MIFKIKWGDLAPKLKKRFSLQEEARSPIFYFESETEIYAYQGSKGGYTLCSSLSKESIQDLVAFKQEYLADAVELTEKPNSQQTLAIKLE